MDLTDKENTSWMGRKFNTDFGFLELPPDILEVGIFDDFFIFYCLEGEYKVTKNYGPHKGSIIEKVLSKCQE